MEETAFIQALLRVVAYYSAGVRDGSYEHLMDDLTQQCTDEQWERVTATTEQVDEWLAETDQGTTAQKEKLAAKREGRRSRYPNVFEQGTPEADARIAALRREFGTKE